LQKMGHTIRNIHQRFLHDLKIVIMQISHYFFDKSCTVS
jgi:hypothetical protein